MVMNPHDAARPAVAPTRGPTSAALTAAAANETAEHIRFEAVRGAVVAGRRRRRAILDALLAALVIALAVLLASVPIRNSGIWSHLAAGRQLVTGELDGGIAPGW